MVYPEQGEWGVRVAHFQDLVLSAVTGQDTLLPRPVEIIGAMSAAAQTRLPRPVGLDQPFFDRPQPQGMRDKREVFSQG